MSLSKGFEISAESVLPLERVCLYGDTFNAMTDSSRTTMGAKSGGLVGTAKHSAWSTVCTRQE